MVNSESIASVEKRSGLAREANALKHVDLRVALLTGCQDKSYAVGLAVALASKGVQTDAIGNDRVDSPEYHTTTNLKLFNFGGILDNDASALDKLYRLLNYYARLVRYVTFGAPPIVHVLWNGKFEYFDRTILMLYFKLLGKRIVLTAHNVNKAKRDSEDSLLNRLTLQCQYRLADRVFVHTERMKSELIKEFKVEGNAVKVIPFGIYTSLPDTDLTPELAKKGLGLAKQERTILFFGRIVPYKGLEYLLAAFETVHARNPNYRLIIAGEPMPGHEGYLGEIQRTIDGSAYQDRVIQKLQFIGDAETERYFKAADVLALPYKDIFQSGVLFVGYTFGLPVIGADVGSFRDDVIEGKTGYVFKPGDPADLANKIETYFESDLYKGLDRKRREIREYVAARHSWDEVGEITRNVYQETLGNNLSLRVTETE
jgi:glycosyltransferase involved in cell wall biosynthesis